LALHETASKRGKYEFKDYIGLEAKDSWNNNDPAILKNGFHWMASGGPQGLKLNGIDDYVDCGSGASSNLTGDLTVTAWVCPDSFGAGPLAGGLGRIVDRHGDASGGFAFYVKEEIQGIAYLTYGGSFVNSDPDVIDLAQWQHVAVTYSDASDTVTFYVNGQPAGGDTNYQTNPNDSANAPLIIGNRAASDRGFDGMLSDVRIYSRTLAADEISAIYRTYEVIEAKNLGFELSTTDSDDYVAQDPLALPAGATFIDNIFTWRPWYNQAASYEITFEVPGQPGLTQSVPMIVENVSLKPWYQDFLETNNKY
ncbi:MAG: LamG domain-containing protein, partial [Planctomycetes bacterium]|nr:LamG domain-containing protein [Planctomycetota bacterium]